MVALAVEAALMAALNVLYWAGEGLRCHDEDEDSLFLMELEDALGGDGVRLRDRGDSSEFRLAGSESRGCTCDIGTGLEDAGEDVKGEGERLIEFPAGGSNVEGSGVELEVEAASASD